MSLTPKQQLEQVNNPNLLSILSTIQGLPNQESLKHGAYVWKKSDSPLPSGYTELQYIKGTGTQYIDTGFKPNNNSCYEIKYQTIPASNYVGVMGAEHDWSSTSFALWCKHAGFANSTISDQTWYGESPVIMKFDKGNLYKDGVQVWSVSGSFQCDYSAYLFGINRAGTLTEPVDNLKIYYVKIWDNGTLVRDFIPCKNSSGTVGLFDLVNRRFYQNNGTGTFTAGDEILRNDSYVVADDETKYPDGGLQGGHYYEKVGEGVNLLEFTAFSKISIDKITFSSRTDVSVYLNHSLGEIPKIALLFSDFNKHDTIYDIIYAFFVDNGQSDTYPDTVWFTYYPSNLSKIYGYSVGSGGFNMCSSTQLRFKDRVGENYSQYYKAGIEYTLITMA